MWINDVMASSIEENYGLNLEWISSESLSDAICVDEKDCPIVVECDDEEIGGNKSLDGFHDPDYIEIQVTEEEVVTDDWDISSNGAMVVEDCLGFSIASMPENGIPMLDDNDDYGKRHTYACDYCHLRFNKQSSLASHIISHQLEEGHRCNLCNINFKRRISLMEHMKVHSINSSQSDELRNGGAARVSSLKKKQSKKKAKWEVGAGKRDESKLVEPECEVSDDEDKYPVMDPSRPYVCQHCGVGFAREKALMSHTMIHKGDSAFECETCHDMFPTEEQLLRHEVAKHPHIAGSASPLRRPTPTHSHLKTFRCDQCDASFNWYNQLKRHQRTEHLKEEECRELKYSCNDCNVTLKNESSYIAHRELHQSSSEIHSCNTCGEEFGSLNELHSHMKSRHKWSHLCHVCGTAYRDAKALTRHLLAHADRPSSIISCSSCNLNFSNKAKLKKHMDTEHDGIPTATCMECGEVFSDAVSLVSHKQSVHSSSRLFPCLQCGKTFTSRSSQQIHVRVHTGEKPYDCRFCWKKFADGGTLRKHERIHTGEKPYVCPVCTKAFNQRVVLREHVRAHHSGAEGRGRKYECTVCGDIFRESVELCAHLVKHSDENTAKHRLPTSTSRKYSRRKKAGSPDVVIQKGRTRFPPPVLEEESPPRQEEGLGRARIVRSGKRGAPKGQNKKYMKSRKGSTRPTSGMSYASKYIVSHSESKEDSEISRGVYDIKQEYDIGSFSQGEGDLPPSSPPTLFIKKEIGDGSMGMDPQFISGLEPIVFDMGGDPQSIETCIVDDIGVQLKLEVRTQEDHLSAPSNTDSMDPDIKSEDVEMVSCEICYETFLARSDLLKHIEIHI